MKDWRSYNFESVLSGTTTKDANYQGLVASCPQTFQALRNNRNFLDAQAVEREDLDEMVEFMLESFPEGGSIEDE